MKIYEEGHHMKRDDAPRKEKGTNTSYHTCARSPL